MTDEAKDDTKGTEYVVLGTDNGETLFEIGKLTAVSADAARRTFATGPNPYIAYVAVPVRSFEKVGYKTRTTLTAETPVFVTDPDVGKTAESEQQAEVPAP